MSEDRKSHVSQELEYVYQTEELTSLHRRIVVFMKLSTPPSLYLSINCTQRDIGKRFPVLTSSSQF